MLGPRDIKELVFNHSGNKKTTELTSETVEGFLTYKN